MGTSSTAASADPLSDLTIQVQDLQRRIANLEKHMGDLAIPVPLPAAAAPENKAPMGVIPGLPPNFLTVLGRVLLVIAGAYVLRAITDFGAIPRIAGIAAGILYALACLIVAARLREQDGFAVTMTSSASMVILGSLLWEACVRLKAILNWPSMAAIIFTSVLAMALSWRKQRAIIPTVVLVSSTLLTLALLVATEDLFPFSIGLLALAAIAELAACNSHRTGARWLVSAAADSAVLLFSWLMSRDHGLPEGYAPTSTNAVLTAQLLLIMIYIISAATQTIFRRRTLAFSEMLQTACVLLIGIGGIVSVFHASRAAMLAVGTAGLIGGITCYVISFLLFDQANKWNFRAWSTFGLALVLAGTCLPFSSSGFWLLWSGCAVACCWAAMGARRPTLGLHGALYLTLAAAVSGATSQPLRMLLGAGNPSIQWFVSLGVLAIAIPSWAAIAMSSRVGVARWRQQVSSLVIAANIAWILSGITMYTIVSAVARLRTAAAPSDTLGTVVLTTFSVAFIWAGMHWRMRELVWLAYGFMGVGAWKLLTRDFLHEHNLALVVSLLFYGCALILVPRMLREREPEMAREA